MSNKNGEPLFRREELIEWLSGNGFSPFQPVIKVVSSASPGPERDFIPPKKNPQTGLLKDLLQLWRTGESLCFSTERGDWKFYPILSQEKEIPEWIIGAQALVQKVFQPSTSPQCFRAAFFSGQELLGRVEWQPHSPQAVIGEGRRRAAGTFEVSLGGESTREGYMPVIRRRQTLRPEPLPLPLNASEPIHPPQTGPAKVPPRAGQVNPDRVNHLNELFLGFRRKMVGVGAAASLDSEVEDDFPFLASVQTGREPKDPPLPKEKGDGGKFVPFSQFETGFKGQLSSWEGEPQIVEFKEGKNMELAPFNPKDHDFIPTLPETIFWEDPSRIFTDPHYARGVVILVARRGKRPLKKLFIKVNFKNA